MCSVEVRYGYNIAVRNKYTELADLNTEHDIQHDTMQKFTTA